MTSEHIITNPGQASLDFSRAHEYRVRRSSRAKHMRINAHPDSGIEVVVPRRMSLKHVQPFVRQHQDWINRQVARLGLDRPRELPEDIQLRMINEHWQVCYETGKRQQYRLKQHNNTLTIAGPDRDIDNCRVKLHQWLRQQARQHLPERLNHLGQQTGLSYNKVSIRTQRTRWGSCSSIGNINLNDRLILLPTELANYVMIHELCHTRHMNHSTRFWQLVKSHVPDYRIHEKQLRESRQYLPSWI